MVLIKEVVVIILFFILWTYSIYLFYRWFIIKGFISHFPTKNTNKVLSRLSPSIKPVELNFVSRKWNKLLNTTGVPLVKQDKGLFRYCITLMVS